MERTGFTSLPGEIIQKIAANFADFNDVFSLSLTSKSIRALVISSTVIKTPFLAVFDLPTEKRGYNYQESYMKRRKILGPWLRSDDKTCLLKQKFEGIIEVISDITREASTDKNFFVLLKFIEDFPLLFPVRRHVEFPASVYTSSPGHDRLSSHLNSHRICQMDSEHKSLLMALQVTLSPLALNARLQWDNDMGIFKLSLKDIWSKVSQGKLYEEPFDKAALLTNLCNLAKFMVFFLGRGSYAKIATYVGFIIRDMMKEDRGVPCTWEKRICDGPNPEIWKYWMGVAVTMDYGRTLPGHYPDAFAYASTRRVPEDNADLLHFRLYENKNKTVFEGAGVLEDDRPIEIVGKVTQISPLHAAFPDWKRVHFIKTVTGGKSFVYDGCLVPGGRAIIGNFLQVKSGEQNPTINNFKVPDNLVGGSFLLWGVSHMDYLIEMQVRQVDFHEDDFLNP